MFQCPPSIERLTGYEPAFVTWMASPDWPFRDAPSEHKVQGRGRGSDDNVDGFVGRQVVRGR